jgi:hypothetical protein
LRAHWRTPLRIPEHDLCEVWPESLEFRDGPTLALMERVTGPPESLVPHRLNKSWSSTLRLRLERANRVASSAPDSGGSVSVEIIDNSNRRGEEACVHL